MPDRRLAQAETYLKRRLPSDAEKLLSAVLVTPGLLIGDRRIALVMRAQAHETLNALPLALADLRAALAIESADAPLHNRLGILLADAGDTNGAIEAFARAVEADPTHARAWNNLGNALRSAGRTAESRSALERAVALQPDNALAWSNLGVVARELGDNVTAEAALSRALTLEPEHRPALIALASTLRALGRIDEAIAYYVRAARLDASDQGVLLALAGTLSERDDLALARGAYRTLRAAKPQSLRAALGEALTLPMIHSDTASIAAARADFARGLSELEGNVEALVRGRSFGEVIDELCWTNFLLAYHGEDDRELQARFAGLIGKAIDLVAPEWRKPLPRPAKRSRVRIGFASALIADGTVGRYFRSWMTGLDRTRFEIYVYHFNRELTPLIQELAPSVDIVRRFPSNSIQPSAIAPVIRGDALDVLVYPELGMDATTFALAALRLAPLQYAGWGHPVTTGHATINAFLSCAAMEPPEAELHYTERLLQLPGIGTQYLRPSMPAASARAELGLPEVGRLFLCPQSLFKIHPDNDALFARVLAEVEGSRLVMFAGRHPALTAKFRARFETALARVNLSIDERVVVIPQRGHDDYLRINLACDAMLDTLHWSGGNTSLDALAAGLPLVTLPGRFMRGRQSAGMLQLMALDELVATDVHSYVAISSRLARDSSWRGEIASRISDARSRVFDDPAPVAALAKIVLESATS
jgi:CRISPR-associated protein Csy1